jgi:hypothetical protein
MRLLILLLLAIPFCSDAQINRSANELACDRVKEYVKNMLFKNHTYKAVSYGQLKPLSKPNSHIVWTIEHTFEIEAPIFSDNKISNPKSYNFSFYLDKRLKVLRAESFMSE